MTSAFSKLLVRTGHFSVIGRQFWFNSLAGGEAAGFHTSYYYEITFSCVFYVGFKEADLLRAGCNRTEASEAYARIFSPGQVKL